MHNGGTFSVPWHADLISATTGMQTDTAGLLKAGERFWNLRKLYTSRRGFSRRDDTLPARLLNEPLTEGGRRSLVWKREELLDCCDAVRGRDKEGY